MQSQLYFKCDKLGKVIVERHFDSMPTEFVNENQQEQLKHCYVNITKHSVYTQKNCQDQNYK